MAPYAPYRNLKAGIKNMKNENNEIDLKKVFVCLFSLICIDFFFFFSFLVFEQLEFISFAVEGILLTALC